MVSSLRPCFRSDFVIRGPDNCYEKMGRIDLFRRVKSEQWSKMVQRVERLSLKVLSPDVLHAFELGDWRHPVFRDHGWMFVGLYAFLEGKISEETWVRLAIFNMCLESKDPGTEVECLQLIDDRGEVDLRAVDQLKQLMNGYELLEEQ